MPCRPTASMSCWRSAPTTSRTRRVAAISGHGAAAARVARLATIYRFLEDEGYETAERKRIAGDASSRSYERLTVDGRSAHHDELAGPSRTVRR